MPTHSNNNRILSHFGNRPQLLPVINALPGQSTNHHHRHNRRHHCQPEEGSHAGENSNARGHFLPQNGDFLRRPTTPMHPYHSSSRSRSLYIQPRRVGEFYVPTTMDCICSVSFFFVII